MMLKLFRLSVKPNFSVAIYSLELALVSRSISTSLWSLMVRICASLPWRLQPRRRQSSQRNKRPTIGCCKERRKNKPRKTSLLPLRSWKTP
jgi:hypothetical protein